MLKLEQMAEWQTNIPSALYELILRRREPPYVRFTTGLPLAISSSPNWTGCSSSLVCIPGEDILLRFASTRGIDGLELLEDSAGNTLGVAPDIVLRRLAKDGGGVQERAIRNFGCAEYGG